MTIKARNIFAYHDSYAICEDRSSGYKSSVFLHQSSFNAMQSFAPCHLKTDSTYHIINETAPRATPFDMVVGDLEQPESYRSRQSKWIDEHRLKRGDKLIVTRVATSYEDGWCANWAIGDMLVGSIVTFEGDGPGCLGIKTEMFYYPYFVLEPLK